MVVMLLERVSPGLRGELTRCLLELKAGVFVGRVSAMVREPLWARACKAMGEGGGILMHSADNEQGFELRFWGTPSRRVRDFEGLQLVQVPRERL